MGRVERYPITLRLYLGKSWQSFNRHGFPLEPVRLVVSMGGEDTKLSLVELRGSVLGRRDLARPPAWILPLPVAFFDPSRGAGLTGDCDFPAPRETWWPGERLVVEFSGELPIGAAVLAARKEFRYP